VSLSANAKDHATVAPRSTDPPLRSLFHRLNNQLGVVLAHAELLELKAPDAINRTRAEQVVNSVLEAMRTAKEIRIRSEADEVD
jgi:hypothetical protein